MTDTRKRLYDLLPSVYRTRDSVDRGEPLRHYLDVLDNEALIIEENLAQLYDDLFAETAAPWVLPYLAELIGLHGLPGSVTFGMTPRAEVANTIGYRRRKGTAAVLEQIARDVTGWPARAVEYFELLSATQYMNHTRPRNHGTAHIRDAGRMQWTNTPFERTQDQPDITHLLEVRRVGNRRGKYNIPNIGIHVWRIGAYPVSHTPAARIALGDNRHFLFSPLGTNMPFITQPLAEDEITRLSETVNVPWPITRRMLRESLALYYGRSFSIDGVDLDEVLVCDLSDVTDGGGGITGWAHTPPPEGMVAVDPLLGRIAFHDDRESAPLVSYAYGFSANIGGGEYDRVSTFDDLNAEVVRISSINLPADHQTIVDGLDARGGESGIVEIDDSGTYPETPAITANGRQVELRSANGRRALVALDDGFLIEGDDEGQVTLSGLVITGATIRIVGVRRVRLVHCTLVPGRNLLADGSPEQPGAASIIVESPETELEIDSCIVGGLRIDVDAGVTAINSIIDAQEHGIAYSSEDGSEAGGVLTLRNCTVLGKVHTRMLDLASNTIFLARRIPTDDSERWPGPVLADRRQEGCVRFSYVPAGSRTPRRYQCQPEREIDDGWMRPVLTSSRYADPGYCQLDHRTAEQIRSGADDESEMGVFHDLFQPQRERYLQTRLDEYLRFGLEAGVFFAS